MGQEKMVPAVFLDRDGVINKDIGYFSDPKKLAIFRSSLEGLRALQEAGFMLIVVTNQSGIAGIIIEEKNVLMSSKFQKDGIFNNIKQWLNLNSEKFGIPNELQMQLA